MVNIVPVSRDRHARKGWRRPLDYGFASKQSVVPLLGIEFVKAGVVMPIAFVEQSGRYLPVGLMSPLQGRNLFVAPNGQWLGSYIPAALRAYPFCAARVKDSNRPTVCIDEDSGLVIDPDANTEKFFEDDGGASAAMKEIIRFFKQVEKSRVDTDLAVTALVKARVIQAWPLVVQKANQKVPVPGLYRINRAALNSLDDPTLLKLQRVSALAIAHWQLMSMETVGAFRQLLVTQEHMSLQTRPLPPASSLFTPDDDGTIKFS